ncbi:MAG: calcium-binding protein, partial [Cyanobacteria bacterium J06559_3]
PSAKGSLVEGIDLVAKFTSSQDLYFVIRADTVDLLTNESLKILAEFLSIFLSDTNIEAAIIEDVIELATTKGGQYLGPTADLAFEFQVNVGNVVTNAWIALVNSWNSASENAEESLEGWEAALAAFNDVWTAENYQAVDIKLGPKGRAWIPVPAPPLESVDFAIWPYWTFEPTLRPEDWRNAINDLTGAGLFTSENFGIELGGGLSLGINNLAAAISQSYVLSFEPGTGLYLDGEQIRDFGQVFIQVIDDAVSIPPILELLPPGISQVDILKFLDDADEIAADVLKPAYDTVAAVTLPMLRALQAAASLILPAAETAALYGIPHAFEGDLLRLDVGRAAGSTGSIADAKFVYVDPDNDIRPIKASPGRGVNPLSVLPLFSRADQYTDLDPGVTSSQFQDIYGVGDANELIRLNLQVFDPFDPNNSYLAWQQLAPTQWAVVRVLDNQQQEAFAFAGQVVDTNGQLRTALWSGVAGDTPVIVEENTPFSQYVVENAFLQFTDWQQNHPEKTLQAYVEYQTSGRIGWGNVEFNLIVGQLDANWVTVSNPPAWNNNLSSIEAPFELTLDRLERNSAVDVANDAILGAVTGLIEVPPPGAPSINQNPANAASPGNDTRVGRDTDDILFGYSGNDELDGAAGNDILYGDGNLFYDFKPVNEATTEPAYVAIASSDDTLRGGVGNDILFGGEGTNAAFGGDDDDLIVDANPLGAFDGGEGNDTLVFLDPAATSIALDLAGAANIANVEVIGGSDFDDQITTAPETSPRVYGFGGNDTLTGSAGADRLYGDYDLALGDVPRFAGYWDILGLDPDNLPAGDDVIQGGGGADVIFAGGGDDTVYLEMAATVDADDKLTGLNISDGLFASGGDGFDALIIDITNTLSEEPSFTIADLPAALTDFERVELRADIEEPDPDPDPGDTPNINGLLSYYQATSEGVIFNDEEGNYWTITEPQDPPSIRYTAAFGNNPMSFAGEFIAFYSEEYMYDALGNYVDTVRTDYGIFTGGSGGGSFSTPHGPFVVTAIPNPEGSGVSTFSGTLTTNFLSDTELALV